MKRAMFLVLFLSGTLFGQEFNVNSFGQLVDFDGSIVVSQPVVTYSVPIRQVRTIPTVLYVGPYTPVRVHTHTHVPVRTGNIYTVPFQVAPVRRAVSSLLNCLGST